MVLHKMSFGLLAIIYFIGCGILDNKPKDEYTINPSPSPIEQGRPLEPTPTKSTHTETTKAYYENGQLKSEGIYRNGKKDGLHKEWTKEGILMLEGEYKNGLANGLMIWYHGDGHMAAKGSMINNQRHGFWLICGITPDEPCIHANFTYEIRTGIWKIFHDNGQIAREQTWKADNMQYEECWDEDGKKIKCVGY